MHHRTKLKKSVSPRKPDTNNLETITPDNTLLCSFHYIILVHDMIVIMYANLFASNSFNYNHAIFFKESYPRGYNAEDVYDIAAGHEDYDYDENSGRGPSDWENLKPEWTLCKKGKLQSPVDFTNVTVESVTDSEKVYTQYQPSLTTLVNRGHDIAVSYHCYYLKLFNWIHLHA